jgi:hypothetical protein
MKKLEKIANNIQTNIIKLNIMNSEKFMKKETSNLKFM